MNFIKKARLMGAVLSTAAMALIMGSCSESGKLTENIPSDISMAMKLNLQQAVENAGCTVDNGRIVLSDELTEAISKEDPAAAMVANQFLAYTEGLDLSEAVFFMRSKREAVAMASMTDKDKVTGTLNTFFGKPESKDGFDCYDVKGGTMAVKGDIIYLSDDLATISKAIEDAKKESLSSKPGLEQFLSADNAFAIVLSAKEADLPSAYRDYWICGSLKFEGPEISGELCLMDTDGRRNAFGEAFGELSSDFLRYVPENTQLIAAVGPVKEPALKQVIESAARQMGDRGKYLTDLDGTASVAFHFSDSLTGANGIQAVNKLFYSNDFDWSLIDMIAMLHYPKATAEALTADIKDSFMLQGQTPEATADGLYTFTFDSLRGFFGTVGDYFAIANYPIKQGGNSLNVNLSGKRAVIYAYSTPAKEFAEQFGFDPNIGSECELWLEKDCIKGKARFTNTDGRFLQTIISVLLNPDMQEFIKAYINESMGQPYCYEPDDEVFIDEDFEIEEVVSVPDTI